MATVTITSGPDNGKAFPLGDSSIIGRLPRCTIPIKDTRASREHARIYRTPDGFFIVDLNSKNGINVNGEKAERKRLATGDQIQVGDTWFRIEIAEEDLRAAVASAPRAVAERTPASGGVLLRSKDGTGQVSDEPLRSASTKAQLRTGSSSSPTRTSLAWLRTDLAQASALYRILVVIGILLLAAGLGYFAWWVVA